FGEPNRRPDRNARLPIRFKADILVIGEVLQGTLHTRKMLTISAKPREDLRMIRPLQVPRYVVLGEPRRLPLLFGKQPRLVVVVRRFRIIRFRISQDAISPRPAPRQTDTT